MQFVVDASLIDVPNVFAAFRFIATVIRNKDRLPRVTTARVRPRTASHAA